MFIYLLSTLAGRIDHGHHANKAFLALHDTVELGKAVEIATNITKPSSVLLIIINLGVSLKTMATGIRQKYFF